MFLGENIGLVCASRLSALGFDNILVTNKLVEMKFASHDTNSRLFPLRTFSELKKGAWNCNFTIQFLKTLPKYVNEDDWPSILEVGDYVLGILNSMKYRSRYHEHIKNDFPRIAVPKEESVFDEVASIGSEIRANQLERTPPSSDFGINGEVAGDFATPKWSNESVAISKSCSISNVPKELFDFTVAGYQVCRTWASAGNKSGIQRKGAKLTEGMVTEYRRLLTQLRNLHRLRATVDEVIDQHGGWPDAFVTEPIELDDKETQRPFG